MVLKADDKSINVKNKPDPNTFTSVVFNDELYKLIAIPRTYYAESYKNVIEMQYSFQ